LRRIGSHCVDEFPLPVVRIACRRAGRYRLDGLIARFGADAALPHVLVENAACDRRTGFSIQTWRRGRSEWNSFV
jgi:hypothetical protein